ncbi:MAG: hypothetical protein DWQ37_13530 [Planctomycetota bacterium]|nr:MAG: hypothetical protein DWQ37_13530 [Planctomycetota bacterium]
MKGYRLARFPIFSCPQVPMHRTLPVLVALGAAFVIVAGTSAADDTALRELRSRHLTLTTDLPADDEVESLPEHFEQALEQWCAYFGVEPARLDDWHLRGCLMHSVDRFRAAGLLPAELPEFTTGYSWQQRFWLCDQTSEYYRRHLLLHEGVHCFMQTILGGLGTPWYAEGIAELLATHRLDGDRLTVNVFPGSRDEVPQWGRIEVVQQAFAGRRAMTLARVFALGRDGRPLHSQLDPYGWCWAAAAFLEHHPRYRERFRALHSQVDRGDFEVLLEKLFADDRAQLAEDWQIFVANIDYGYDFERMEIDFVAGEPLPDGGRSVEVAADRGWQSTGVALQPGRTYRLAASGRYTVAREAEPWISEPAGVTIEYHDGRPLGMLLAAVRADDPSTQAPSGLIQPLAIGLERTFRVERAGTLYLRINDSPGRLSDNEGVARVEISTP